MKKTNFSIWWRNVRKFRFVHRKYKDRLFQRVFQDKKDLLSLYNAINGTAYSNEDDLEITTLEDVIFMSMKNDKSFIISSTMNLYEHQSTVNPNMPIRGLLYFARLYEEYIKLHSLDIYGHPLVKLPLPQYIVFYNGSEPRPDSYELKLSDAFECDPNANTMSPALECTARVLNVNFGHNKELMNSCERLMHYSQFIDIINSNIQKGMSTEHAIDEASKYCIEHNILSDILSKNLGEVRSMLLTEFNEKLFKKTTFNEGMSVGYTEGISVVKNIMAEINNGNDTFDKLTALGYDPELVKEILELK